MYRRRANALGYSQAFHPLLVHPANWGGVYAVSFLIVAVSSAITLIIMKRSRWTVVASFMVVMAVLFVIMLSKFLPHENYYSSDTSNICVVAVQPNVPMALVKSSAARRPLPSGRRTAKLSPGPAWPSLFPSPRTMSFLRRTFRRMCSFRMKWTELARTCS